MLVRRSQEMLETNTHIHNKRERKKERMNERQEKRRLWHWKQVKNDIKVAGVVHFGSQHFSLNLEFPFELPFESDFTFRVPKSVPFI